MTGAELEELLPGARAAFDWLVVYPSAFRLDDPDPVNHQIANVICYVAAQLASRPDTADGLVLAFPQGEPCPVSGKPVRPDTVS